MIRCFVFRILRVVALVVLSASLASLTVGAKKPDKKSKTPETVGATVTLSPFEVRAESMEFSHWRKVSSPHFVIYTDASAKEATRLVRQMEMMHQATAFYLKRRNAKLPPTIIVLPEARSDWRKISSVGNVEWEVATSLVGTVRDLALVEYDWSRNGLEPMWSMLSMRGARSMNVDGPLWFKRGLASYFSTVVFKGDTLTLGRQGTDAYWIRTRGWMEWERFFQIHSKSPEYVKDTDDHMRYEGQCGVFAHYVLTHADQSMVLRMLQWAAYLDAGNEPTEAAFKEVFGHDFKAWQKLIEDMLNGGKYSTGTIKFPPAALQFEIVDARVGAREMRELFVLAQIMNQQRKESDEALDSLLERGVQTESLRELLSDACKSRGRSEEELEQLKALIEDGSTNPRVYGRAAVLTMRNVVPAMNADARLGEEVNDIRLWCGKAIELEPLYVEANEFLAWAEALAPSVEQRNLEVIAAICRRLDGHAKTDMALAALATARWRAGHAKQARSLAEIIVTSPLSRPPAKGLAREILARLNAPSTDGK